MYFKDISLIASELLGSEVYIDWPLLRKGLVSQIWTKTTRLNDNILRKNYAVVICNL